MRASTLIRPHFDLRFAHKVMGSKVAGIPIDAILGFSLESPGKEKPFGCGLCGKPQSIL
jgi:hypothetical protein